MNERELLAKAQEAEAVANASLSQRERHRWEEIAKEFRQLAEAVKQLQKS